MIVHNFVHFTDLSGIVLVELLHVKLNNKLVLGFQKKSILSAC